MKKTFLFSILLFQFAFMFGQTPIAEDEKVIQYSTKWGAWVTAAGNNTIQFSARLKWYDKKSKLYAWDVRYKVTKMPIAFEWKITNQVFTGASDYDETVEENDGYYKTGVFDTKDNSNSINGSGFGIYSNSKTTLYYQVRNVCYEFDGREPNCDQNKPKTTNTSKQYPNQNNKNSSLNSLSVEQLENKIIANLKKNFQTGSYYFNWEPYGGSAGTIGLDQITADRFAKYWVKENEAEPNTLYIAYHTMSPPSSYLYTEKFINLNIEKLNSQGQYLLHFIRDAEYNHGNSDFGFAIYLYDFGANDENYIELKNAIEALKNPNKSGSGNKKNDNVQKTGASNSQNKIVEKSIEVNSALVQESINTYNLGVVAFNENRLEDAEKLYKKAIEINQNNKNAYLNLASLKLNDEKEIIEKMNNIKDFSVTSNKKYEELNIKRINIYKSVLPLLEKAYKLDPNNEDLKITLTNIYNVLGLKIK